MPSPAPSGGGEGQIAHLEFNPGKGGLKIYDFGIKRYNVLFIGFAAPALPARMGIY
jgi:hypothetical protein